VWASTDIPETIRIAAPFFAVGGCADPRSRIERGAR
jgi:hypothetical protein